jgi:hypothetical protein
MKKRHVAAVLILPALSGAADARLTCDQLVAVAHTTVELRNQGVALNALLADVGRDSIKAQFNAEEVAVMRRVIEQTYTGGLSPFELRQSCQEKDGK